MSPFDVDPARVAAAAGVVAAYGAMCLAVIRGERRKAAADAARGLALAGASASASAGAGAGAGPVAGAGDAPARPVLVVHASQTGAAERLAWQTAQALHGAVLPVRVAGLGTLAPADLLAAASVLFIASTCGEGDAPDGATPFVRRHMGDAPASSLAGVHYGLLALGDREFTHFCAFGRRLDDWLARHGARPMFGRVDVDAMREADLARWRHALGRVAHVGDTPAWRAPERQAWRLARRTHVNPGSSGAPVFHLELEPPPGIPPAWEPGDLLQIRVPHAPDQPREYSIASIPSEGRAHLLVRQERRADGRLGLASGWLTQDAPVGEEVWLNTLAHRNFRLGPNADRPLILIGSGTGIAGLRAHLSARAARGARTGDAPRNWLVFGERQAAHDFHFRADVQAWRADGTIARLDLAFSRDQAARLHVQDRLRAQPEAVRQWLDDGAAVYVCGSLRGMAAGVEQALVEIVGIERLEALIDEGRYRRDVY